MKEENTFIGRIALSRKNLVELIVVVVLLSFGINLIADQLLNWLREMPVVIVLFGTLLCLVPIAYTLMSLFGTRVAVFAHKWLDYIGEERLMQA